MQICYDVWEQQPIGFVLIPMGKHKPTDKLFSTLLASIKFTQKQEKLIIAVSSFQILSVVCWSLQALFWHFQNLSENSFGAKLFIPHVDWVIVHQLQHCIISQRMIRVRALYRNVIFSSNIGTTLCKWVERTSDFFFLLETTLGVVLQGLQSGNTCRCHYAGMCIPARCALSILLLD